jgi:hypothetical protein
MVEILIWIVAIFAAGSFLVLERRCLGQRALVQPLALCLVAGWVVDNTATGLWFGVTLQLLSVAPSRSVDWAFASAVSSAALLTSEHFGHHLTVGCSGTTALLLVTVTAGMVARSIERRYARVDRASVDQYPPWQADDPVRALEKTVYRATRRWFMLGGFEVLAGLGLALLAVKGATYVTETPQWFSQLSAVTLPSLGAAVAVSILTGRRFIVWAGASAACALGIFSVVMP